MVFLLFFFFLFFFFCVFFFFFFFFLFVFFFFFFLFCVFLGGVGYTYYPDALILKQHISTMESCQRLMWRGKGANNFNSIQSRSE